MPWLIQSIQMHCRLPGAVHPKTFDGWNVSLATSVVRGSAMQAATYSCHVQATQADEEATQAEQAVCEQVVGSTYIDDVANE